MFSKRVLIRTGMTAALVAGLAFATGALAGNYGKKKADIVDTAVAAGDFSTLAAALQAGDLVGTLKSDGPFTVFAPTDAAFAKLPEGTLEMLLKPENKDKLVAILTYHVVPGKVTSAEVVKLDSAKTVEGSDVKIHVKNDSVYINDARVVAADVGASNGVIHVIDAVILPQS
jgi:uncharacterized surface protein with fasciclin (FAS1) repeats